MWHKSKKDENESMYDEMYDETTSPEEAETESEENAESDLEENAETDVKKSSDEKIQPDFAEQKNVAVVEQELEEYLKEDHSGGKKKKKKFGHWSKKKKLIVGGCAVLLVFVGGRIVLGGNKQVVPVVAAMPLAKGDVIEMLSLSGPVSGTESADVVSNLHAEVLQIMVREGDRVEKGQTLAVIDSSDARKAVDIAQNSYDLAVSEYNENIRDTQHKYEKAVQDYNTAKLNYDRNKVLFDAGDISSADLEAAGNALKDAAREKDSYTVEKGKALPDKSYELKVKSAQFELDQKKTDLENAEVKSPITGTVVRVNSKVGQFADKPEDEKPMFIVENLDNLEMEIAVSEYSISKVKVGQKAQIDADILNGVSQEGEIISISPTGEEKGGGSSERVVPATIQIEGGASNGLIAGITAKASLVTGEAKGVFTVPQTAIVTAEDGSINVASVDASTNTIHMIPVTTGVESDLDVEINPVEEGALTEGMKIVISPAGLAEGMAVTAR